MKKSCPTKTPIRFSSLASKKGFTLVELLVVISIIGIFFGLSVAQYRRYNRRQVLFQAARELEGNLRLAQDKALAGQKPDGWCNGPSEVLDGHRLYFESDRVYKIQAGCSASGPNEFTDIKTVNLAEGVDGNENDTVLFRVLGRGARNFTFTLSAFGNSIDVTVNTAGEIEVGDIYS